MKRLSFVYSPSFRIQHCGGEHLLTFFKFFSLFGFTAHREKYHFELWFVFFFLVAAKHQVCVRLYVCKSLCVCMTSLHSLSMCMCVFVHMCLWGAGLNVDAMGSVGLQVDGLGCLLSWPSINQRQVPHAARHSGQKLPSCHSSRVGCSTCHTKRYTYNQPGIKFLSQDICPVTRRQSACKSVTTEHKKLTILSDMNISLWEDKGGKLTFPWSSQNRNVVEKKATNSRKCLLT